MAIGPERPIGGGPIGEGPIGPGPGSPSDPTQPYQRSFPDVLNRVGRGAFIACAAIGLVASTPLTLIKPFQQTDWPVPRGAARANLDEVQGFPSPIRDYASGLNDANKRKTDWPNPRGPQRSIDLLTWVQSLQQTTLQPGPFPQRDWPVARPLPRLPDVQAQNLLGTTLATVAAAPAPFYQTDWPVVRSLRLLPDAQAQNILSTTLATVVVAGDPFKQTEWPVVRPLPRLPDAQAQNILSTTLATVQAAPFAQTSWPVPTGLGPRQAESRGFETPIRDYASGLNDANKRKYDWPNPTGRPPLNVGFVKGLSFQLIQPFAQADWPVPKGLGPRQAYTAGFSGPVRDYAVGLNDANKRPSDWPVPRGPKRSIDALTWTQSLALGITTQGVKPFAKSDWPLQVPRVYRQIADSVGFSTPVRSYAVGLNAANRPCFNWTVPPGAAEREQRGFVFASRRILSVERPFIQDKWPVPRGAKPKVADWQFSLSLALQAQPFQQYNQTVTATLVLTVDFHICGWGTEAQEPDAGSEQGQASDAWTAQDEQAVAFNVESEQSDPWSEETESDDDYDEQDECGR